MKNNKQIFIAVLLVGLLLLSACAAGRAAGPTDEEALVQQAAAEVFESLGLDAIYEGKTSPDPSGAVFYLFYCEKTNQEYRFDTNGNLVMVHTRLPEGTLGTADALPSIDEEALDALVKEYAAEQLGGKLVGELEIVRKHGFSGQYTYELREVANGIPTGTRIGTTWLQDGTMGSFIPKLGSVYGDQQPEIVLSEEAAIEIALQTVTERVAGTSYALTDKAPECELDASGDKLYYAVAIDTYSEKENYTVIYTVRVDVTDGTVLEVQFTQ